MQRLQEHAEHMRLLISHVSVMLDIMAILMQPFQVKLHVWTVQKALIHLVVVLQHVNNVHLESIADTQTVPHVTLECMQT